MREKYGLTLTEALQVYHLAAMADALYDGLTGRGWGNEAAGNVVASAVHGAFAGGAK